MADQKAFFDVVRRQHRNARIFMVGHSLGGTIAVAYAIRYQHDVDGLILSGTSLKVNVRRLPLMTVIARVASLFLPRLGMQAIDASAISQDKTVVAAYVNDPLVYRGKIRARLGAELISMTQKLPPLLSKLELPMLIMHGTSDRLADPEGSQMLYERVSSTDKTLKLYDGFYHEIFNEPGRHQVLAEMKTWLLKHI